MRCLISANSNRAMWHLSSTKYRGFMKSKNKTPATTHLNSTIPAHFLHIKSSTQPAASPQKTWSPNPPIPSVHLMLLRCNSAAKRGTALAIWASRQACKATFRSTAGLIVKSFVENTLGMEWRFSEIIVLHGFFPGCFLRDVFFLKIQFEDIQKNINTSTNSTKWMKKKNCWDCCVESWIEESPSTQLPKIVTSKAAA